MYYYLLKIELWIRPRLLGVSGFFRTGHPRIGEKPFYAHLFFGSASDLRLGSRVKLCVAFHFRITFQISKLRFRCEFLRRFRAAFRIPRIWIAAFQIPRFWNAAVRGNALSRLSDFSERLRRFRSPHPTTHRTPFLIRWRAGCE